MAVKPNIKTLDEVTPVEELGLQSLSYSRLNSFDWCEAQYFYNYVLKIPQKPNAKAILGNVIHKALEITLRDGEEIDNAELFDNYRAAREEYDPHGEIITDELYDDGAAMLQEFIGRYRGSKVSLTQPELYFEFVFRGCLFRGYIDNILVTEDEVIITDYKTGAFEVSKKDLPVNLQLGIYALYAKYLYPDKKITVSLHYLKSNRVKQHTFENEEFPGIEARLAHAIDGLLENKNFLPTNQSWKCKMCSYREDGSCKAGEFKHNQAASAKNKLIVNDYV